MDASYDVYAQEVAFATAEITNTGSASGYKLTNSNGKLKLAKGISVAASNSDDRDMQAVCYSPNLQTTLTASTNGSIRLFKNSSRTFKSDNLTIGVNARCAAWSPSAGVFCVAGSSGTATSSDGQTWTTHSSAPRSFQGLEYRTGLSKFVGRYGKTFYSSSDGATWTNMFPDAALPSNSGSIYAIAYSDYYDLYCMVKSSNTNVAYVSRDMTHWKRTTLPTYVSTGSIVYSPNDYSFMLLPQSGLKYYLLDVRQLNLANCARWHDN